MLKIIILSLVVGFCYSAEAQKTTEIKIPSNGTVLNGTFEEPLSFNTIVILIAGSGPTDRNGNSFQIKNNALKMLAEDMSLNGIASYRFDKRVLNELDSVQIEQLRFDDFILDVESCIDYFDSIYPNKSIVLIGHSQGATVATIAGQNTKVDKVVSLAGPGRNIADVLKAQLSAQFITYKEELNSALDSLKNGFEISKYPPFLKGIFDTNQPFLLSWIKFDPLEEIKKLNKEILIIQGDTDLQVTLEDAELLKEAVPSAQLKIIKRMNHVLKSSTMDMTENMATYSNPNLPIHKSCLKAIYKFLN